jgi:hypothetical protein
MKVRLTFKSGKKLIEKDVELSTFTLMSLLSDKAIIEIAKQVGSEVYQNYGCYLSAITDIDNVE